MHGRTVEIGVGTFVLAGFLAMIFLALKVSGFAPAEEETYRVSARFDDVAGLRVLSKVSIAGVTVGRVTGIAVDTAYGEAIVTLELQKSVGALASDTSAQILTEGILGARYINLLPGVEEEYLADGDEIFDTQGALVIEKLIGKFISSQL